MLLGRLDSLPGGQSNGVGPMELITLDFETYYSSEYSLSNMTNEEYTRDPRFYAQMVGVKIANAPARVLEPSTLFDPRFRKRIEGAALLCHHAQFDGFILSHHFGLKPAFWLDTLSMARLVIPHAKSHSLAKLATAMGLPDKMCDILTDIKGTRELSPDQFKRLAIYCAHDVELTHAIFKTLAPHVPQEELRVIDATVRLFTEPVLALDTPRLGAYLEAVRQSKEDLLTKLGATKEDLHSSERFAALLRAVGVEPPTKPSPSDPTRACPGVGGYTCENGQLEPGVICPTCGGVGTVDNLIYAFSKNDDGMKELLDHEDERVQTLAAARLGFKSTQAETRCERLIRAAGRGPLPVYLNYAGAHTLRWSGGDKMNWQNLPRPVWQDGKLVTGARQKGEIRQSVLAPEGYVLVVGDLAQIECRMLNWLAGQQDILDMFAAGRDLYSELAAKIYGRPVDKSLKVERHLGKTAELGAGYGMGWSKFQETCRGGALGGPPIHLSDYEARNAIDTYRGSHQQVVELWKQANEVLRVLYEGREMAWGPMQVREHRIYGPGGSYLDYTNLQWDMERKNWYTVNRHGKHAKIYGAKLVENVVQWLSRIVIAQAMLRVGPKLRLAMSTHDELVAVVPEADGPAALEFMLAELRRRPVWAPTLPLDAEGGLARNYSK